MNAFYAYIARAEVGSSRGPVRVAATARGVAAVALEEDAAAFEASLANRGLVMDEGRAGPEATRLAAATAVAVVDLLEGGDPDLGALPVDLGDRPAWDRLVLDAVRAIPRGSTAGYGEIARRIGRPGAARAVGGAVGRNPVGLVIPCHRVIAGDGTLGGYGVATWGGAEAALDLKQALLAAEGVEVRRSARPRARVSRR